MGTIVAILACSIMVVCVSVGLYGMYLISKEIK
ncbi:MAG: hypothetical protein [Caudoviricetes sp.]|nr:MAG: hypothetical protein [Caudoviricetes sp.]